MDLRRVHEQFAARAASRPDRIAVVCGINEVSYAKLDTRANGLAHRLCERGAGRDSVVIVHLARSVDAVVAFLATLKAGAVYLQVDPGAPRDRVEALAEETGCALVLTDAEAAPETRPPAVTVDAEDTAYVVYTSGSTGTPKGVAVTHDSLSHLCARAGEYYRITPDDRVLQFAALSFDTSIEQILVTLLAGATLVLPDTTWAPSELPDRLHAHGVTVMDLTPTYWRRFLTELTAHPAELPVRLTIVGGEAVPAEDCRRALELMPTTRLVNAYGLTETTITTCVLDLTADVLPPTGPAPVGRPLPGTTVHVLDDDLRPTGHGEVYIGGRGVALGYVAAGEADRFLPDPFAPGGRLFRTGDLGRWTPDGNLLVTGRADRQVKIRGFRVEPAEVESTLATHPALDDVVVTDYERAGQRHLAAYVTALPDDLREFTAARLPPHLVPTAFVPVPKIPLRPNGKVDLDALPEPEAETSTEEPAGLLERGLARLWCQVLEVDRVGPADNFFALGGNSIMAAELLAKVRGTFGVLITQVRPLIRLLLEDASLRAFATAVEAARSGTLAGDDTYGSVDFAAEADLDVPIRDTVTDPPNWRHPAHVLLTGATGFLGAHLLRELLTGTDAVVHCLVRATDLDHAAERVLATARHYLGDDLADHRDRIVALPGDLSEPLLGLSEVDFDTLARVVDVVHHPGGRVNFIYPYPHMRPANVDGTREIVRLAGRYRNIPVHHVSTMAVIAGFGTAGIRHVTEETPPGYADHLSVGYVESKWVAEALLRDAADRGLPVAVYRAADISGDSRTGAWNTATEMCAMKRFVVDTGASPVAELPLDYTPVDRFAAAVAHIAGRASPEGEVYHLTNPAKANIAELADRLRARGHEVRDVTWSQWLDHLVRVAVEQPDHPMTPFAPLFIDRCATGEMSVAEMYLETTFPTFTRTNVETALRGSGIEIPPVDAELLDRYLDYLTDVDFLPTP